MNPAFFDAVRASLFGGRLTQDQVEGIEAFVSAWDKHGDGDDRKLAYLLATAKHETANTMQPITERGKRAYFDKYEPGTKIGKALGNTLPGDGFRYRGRGHVQLTGRANYVKAGKKLGVDLAGDPDGALNPTVSARVCIAGCLEGWFTGRKLGDYINAKGTNYVEARRVVNGTDRATLIAGYAVKFEEALLAGRGSPVRPRIPSPGTPIPDSPSLPRTDEPAGLLGLIIAIIKAIFGRKPK